MKRVMAVAATVALVLAGFVSGCGWQTRQANHRWPKLANGKSVFSPHAYYWSPTLDWVSHRFEPDDHPLTINVNITEEYRPDSMELVDYTLAQIMATDDLNYDQGPWLLVHWYQADAPGAPVDWTVPFEQLGIDSECNYRDGCWLSYEDLVARYGEDTEPLPQAPEFPRFYEGDPMPVFYSIYGPFTPSPGTQNPDLPPDPSPSPSES
ncbi:MAG: hypothetical protein LBU05_04880 [Bifidobacteriaceae bacterium]|jgi:hypothetical protein|nr:hypothetical protein [Bifidobacteriaceae bacterium]